MKREKAGVGGASLQLLEDPRSPQKERQEDGSVVSHLGGASGPVGTGSPDLSLKLWRQLGLGSGSSAGKAR